MRFEAVNDVIILVKDKSEIIIDVKDMKQIPGPYTGVIESIGEENEWNIGDRVAFEEMGGVYMVMEDKEYVVITPEMIVGKLN